MFTSKYKKTNGMEDTHHIFKYQDVRRWRKNPDIRFNMIILSRDIHSTLHTPSTNKSAKKVRERIYKEVKKEFWNDINSKKLDKYISEEEYDKIDKVWTFSILKGYNKKCGYYGDNYIDIIEGYEKLEELSKKFDE